MLYKFKVDKLIRDKIPELLSQKKIKYKLTTLEKSDYLQKLYNKLLEEISEVFNAKNKQETTEELADVLEVFLALCGAHNIPFQVVEEKRIVKKIAHGGFEQRIYNAYVEIKEENPHIQYYIDRPVQYPQIFAGY